MSDGAGTTRPASDAAPRPLGSVARIHGPDPGPEGRCTAVRVACPDVGAPARAWIKVRGAPEPDQGRGTVVFLVGGRGAAMYETHFLEGRSLIESLHERGFRTVQICWIDSWLAAAPGETAGPKRLACRSASVARWVFRNVHGEEDGGRFVATGNSAGAVQIAFWLTHYGLDAVLDTAVLTGGPPMSRLDWAAGGGEGEEDAAFEPGWATALVDGSFGYPPDLSGPFSRHDPEHLETFREASICSADARLRYPVTTVSFLFGAREDAAVLSQGRAYRRALQDAGSPYVTEDVVPDTDHHVPGTPEGAERIRNRILEPPGVGE